MRIFTTELARINAVNTHLYRRNVRLKQQPLESTGICKLTQQSLLTHLTKTFENCIYVRKHIYLRF